MTKSAAEAYRPSFHFTPEANWMNDPNGMVYYEGEYHLFYQYHPDGTVWGPMHWGHAVSADLVHWEHLPIALAPDGNGYIFSGSAVVDWQNSSGLFGEGGHGLVAIYTHHDTIPESGQPRQRQSIASSIDRGRTWTPYKGNPVLSDPALPDFRDPKVMWHNATASWIMILAAGDHCRLYRSPDLITWMFAGEFGREEGAHDSVWECPDLFELTVEGDPSRSRWVMLVSIGENAACPEGSRTQYFVGSFDGFTFTNDNPPDRVLWLDYGRDNYAGVTWSDVPAEDGRRLFIGWMSNWKYANLTPTDAWRGAMTLPRELTLRETAEGIRVVQRPVGELLRLRAEHRGGQDIAVEPERPYRLDIPVRQAEIRLEMVLQVAGRVTVVLRTGDQEVTLIGYDAAAGTLFVDRTASGVSGFHPQFAGRHEAELHLREGRLLLHLYVDRSSVEVFAEDGLLAMTDLIFPADSSDGDSGTLEITADGGAAKLVALDVYALKP